MLYFMIFVNDKWPYRLIVRTRASQALNLGAIPSKVTKHLHIKRAHCCALLLCFDEDLENLLSTESKLLWLT